MFLEQFCCTFHIINKFVGILGAIPYSSNWFNADSPNILPDRCDKEKFACIGNAGDAVSSGDKMAPGSPNVGFVKADAGERVVASNENGGGVIPRLGRLNDGSR